MSQCLSKPSPFQFRLVSLMGAMTFLGAAFIRPVYLVPLITFGVSSWIWLTTSRRVGLSLGVVSSALYFPFNWVLVEQGRLLDLWPLLPGFVAGVWAVALFPVNAHFAMGIATLFLLVCLTSIGAKGGGRLVVAGVAAFVISAIQSVMAHGRL